MKIALPLLATLGLVATTAGAQTAASSPPTPPQWHKQHAPMPRIDANADHYIDRKEAAANPRISKDFDQIDADHDDKLSRQELRTWRNTQRRQRMVERMDKVDGQFTAADADHDDGLSQTEAARSGIRGLSEHFAAADVDHDGKVSRNELNAFLSTARHHRPMHPQRAEPATGK